MQNDHIQMVMADINCFSWMYFVVICYDWYILIPVYIDLNFTKSILYMYMYMCRLF